ncbi:YybH family protein [Microvirga massiliensis]|uniref:YybH family protein n=1 Tax=Microvirga massiliensis TaxID=1033741 RepID=UPI000A4E26C5|nr:nuclear transport factor 2 family protein [Microvirga massiliensis]
MSAVLSRRSLTTAAMFGLAAYAAWLWTPMGFGGAAQAQGVKPIQEPITGNEELGDLSQPQQALAQFYRAFNTRDLKMMDDNFARSDEVAIDNPLGGIRRGADEPHKMYEGVFKSPADVHVEFWDYTIHQVGNAFWAVGRERGTYRDGDAVKDLNIRTTRIFELIDGRWRQMHHHGSIEDAKLLGDYQGAVRSASARVPK